MGTDKDVILGIAPLTFPWQTFDPFLFCVYHNDDYPVGDERMAPHAKHLQGRQIGQDFEGKDGWRMYHGDVVPGFPQHPHRGFETVTIVRSGVVDHSDSLGATARFGAGDTQWLTAGKGISHAEMFPLLARDKKNPLELFQIWLNLPAQSKLVDPHFSMFWREDVPVQTLKDEQGRETSIMIIAGNFGALAAPTPPPKSWASQTAADVAIWTGKMSPRARCRLPAAASGTRRALYFFRGGGLQVAGRAIPKSTRIELRADAEVELVGAADEVEFLLLQGRPIGEPVVQHGPFVMNTAAEIQKAFMDYQREGFGGWPWPNDAPVHDRDKGRFALHPDGRLEKR